MTDLVSRRSALGAAAASGAAMFAGVAQAQDNETAGLFFTTANAPWAPLKVFDTQRTAWEDAPRWRRKSLFVDPDSGSHVFILQVDPGWHGIPSHYHEFHEWAYCLSGDMTNNEFLTAGQKRSTLNLYREGVWLDRPPHSLHGIHDTSIISELGCELIIHEEGTVTYMVEDESGGPYPFRPERQPVDVWTMPRITDTIRDMDWEDHGSVEGLAVKPLADDPGRGFRASLYWAKPGLTVSGMQARGWYRSTGREFALVLSGAMDLQAYADPDTRADRFTASKGTFMERGPNCIAGFAPGQVTERGCVWLQVTYASDSAVVSDRPIEEPTLVG